MIIDSLYEKAVARLVEEGQIQSISSQILALPTTTEKVLFVDNLLKELNLLPKVLNVVKTGRLSMYYRNLGNESFKLNNDYIAWQYYNLSLLHAPINSDYYSFAIANRSAVLHALKKYEECLVDIKTVFDIPNYPKRLTNKLVKRREQCISGMMTVNPNPYDLRQDEIDSMLQLKGRPDEYYLCASEVLQVVENESMGRHIIAKEDISPGDVIAKENPYFTLLIKSQYLFSCHYCLSRSANLYPCDHCCFAFYCSNKCNRSAWIEYHQTECPIMATLIDMDFTKVELLALRTVIKARSQKADWESFYRTIENAESLINTPLQGHAEFDGRWVYDSKYYHSIHTLSTNMDKRSISDIFQKAVTAVVFLYLLKHTDFLKCKNQEDAIKCTAKLLLHHIMTSPTNMHGISCNCEDEKGNFMDEISLASAPYAFLSLLNHSCAPNVVRFNKLGTGQMMLLALRPIKKGMQLLDNYGFHHALVDRATRQKSLKFQYKFNCSCEACFNDWPTYLNLEQAKNLPAGISKTKQKLLDSDNIGNLQKGDLDTALKLFKPLCVLLKMLESYAPCVELADCQESFKQCISIMEELVPFGYNKLVKWTATPPPDVGQ